MMKFKHFLGFLWSLPLSLLMWVLLVILKLSKQIQRFNVMDDLIFMADLKNDGWFCKRFFTNRGWGGFSFGNVIIVVDSNTKRWARTIVHETVHCHQTYKYGILNPMVYLGHYLHILWFHKDKHPYYDHPAEIEARRKAGQRVNIPKEAWTKDKWIFW